ncbi:MAG TPA: MarR family transcriptional regulator [Chloroflexota bacterium]
MAIMAEARWLDAEQQQTWLSFVAATRLLFAELERDLQRDAGIPFSYYLILAILSDMPDRAMRMSELAEVLQISASRLSHAFSRLEENGWVRREHCPIDRRGWIGVLTDEGLAMLKRTAPAHVESVRTHLFDQLTPQQIAELREISGALSRHLVADASPAVRETLGV